MVSKGYAVIPQGVDQFGLKVPFHQGEVGGSLAEVAGVQEQHIAGAVRAADTVNVCCALNYAGLAAAKGVVVAVRIVNVQDCQLLGSAVILLIKLFMEVLLVWLCFFIFFMF